MPAESLSRQSAEGEQRHIFLGASEFQSPTAGGHPIVLTRNPCATGGSHVLQLVDGKVCRVIATRTGAGTPPGPRPSRRGEMRAYSVGGTGMGIVMRARRPVCTRTVDGREQIVYRTREMDENRLYDVEWNGDHYALRKFGGNVEIFKFRPDCDDDYNDKGGGGPCEGGV